MEAPEKVEAPEKLEKPEKGADQRDYGMERDTRLSIRMSAAEKDRVEMMAARLGKSVPNFVRGCFNDLGCSTRYERVNLFGKR